MTHGPTILPRVITPAKDRRVEKDEAKRFLGVDHNDDDSTIDTIIATAFNWLQPPFGCLRLSIQEQTLRLELPCFPVYMIELPCGPVRSISKLSYFDATNTEQTVDPSKYFLDFETLQWTPTFGPISSLYYRKGAVRIEYVAGMSDEEFEATPLRMAMLRIIKQLYDHRDDTVSGMEFDADQFGVGSLVSQFQHR